MLNHLHILWIGNNMVRCRHVSGIVGRSYGYYSSEITECYIYNTCKHSRVVCVTHLDLCAASVENVVERDQRGQ